MFKDYKFTCSERFLKYVQVDTQSDPLSVTFPSTEKQKDLAKILVDELLHMGVKDAHMDEYGYVFGTIESNTDKNVPVICFCSHMDTSPDCSGKNVKPVIHKNYSGGNIQLPGDPNEVLTPEVHAELRFPVFLKASTRRPSGPACRAPRRRSPRRRCGSTRRR